MAYLRYILLAGTAVALAACDGADDVASPGEAGFFNPAPTPTPTPPTPPPTPTPTPPGGPAASCPAGTTDRGVIANLRNCELPSRFTQDTTIQDLPGTIYSLAGPVNVGTDIGGDGQRAGGQRVTLTIQPGVVIFASQGLDYLVVNRGSQLNAVGTPTSPIIFTARDNILGNTTDSSQGLWGGIILLGRAPISNCNVTVPGGSAGCENVIEGTTASLYGGDQPEDSSGTIRYVQIRFSGFIIAANNELQGLTLGGVGDGTAIDHIQVHNSSDDGVEIFGGRVNLSHLALTGIDDDSLDVDVGYQGAVQFVIAAHRDADNGDSMLEGDSSGDEDALPRTNLQLANFTFIQRSTAQGDNAILIRGGMDATLANGIIIGPDNCVDIDATQTIRPADPALEDEGPPVFRSVALACPAPFSDDGNVTTAEIQALFDADPNNRTAFTPSLQNGYINGPNETAVPGFDVTTLNDYFESASYIGAVQNTADTEFENWTCNTGYLTFGGTGLACAAVPATE